ncbi:MAG: DEAD/DEAH box helicase [Chromatiales bacterium]|jgi:SNF2 family DNA or RNA helicase|nr:DEAD/DEAH box helicase [Chromatiales bacterium]
MNILHAFWLPDATSHVAHGGAFHLWVETEPTGPGRREPPRRIHPFQLQPQEWPALLSSLGISDDSLSVSSIQLPTVGGLPLPSLEASQGDLDWPDDSPVNFQSWKIDAAVLEYPIKQLADVHFVVSHRLEALQHGGDFLFWHWFTQALKGLLLRDQYTPALQFRQTTTGRRRPASKNLTLLAGWRWADAPLDGLLATAIECMPAACGAGCKPLLDPEGLLRHCAEAILDEVVRRTQFPNAQRQRLKGSLVAACLGPSADEAPWESATDPSSTYEQWRLWHQRTAGSDQQQGFTLAFRLVEPLEPDGERTPGEDRDGWRLEFLVVALDDPSYQVKMSDYWAASPGKRKNYQHKFGGAFEQQLLLNLGLAARMAPLIWDGLDSATPHDVTLDLQSAFAFLKESAWVLEDAGYKVLVPSWWTPQGRRRAKIRLRPSGGSSSSSGSTVGTGELSLEHLVAYRYQLAIGDEAVNETEWQQLVEAKSPLVQFRGQWVELDTDKMREMLAFLHQAGDEPQHMSVRDVVRRVAADDGFEVASGGALAAMLENLRDQSRLEPVATPSAMTGELRDYQKRGLAWLSFMEKLGLNGCLADDMGLGKTIQVIARLVQEREQPADAQCGAEVGPSLLIAPTSVLGNWQKEMERFAPTLRAFIHHGAKRDNDAAVFTTKVGRCDLVITSYSLARLDLKLLAGIGWRRVILDEAQNIKNPKSAQARAVLKLQAEHRLALTGTPVENRLTDLWSIFNFANPGYLDTQANFRKRFELPVQRDRDAVQTAVLKRLVQPFVLRRLKTDKSIVADLPDKVEAIQYCNLSREQGALYESVVRDVERRLKASDGIARQGLMLSTLTRLKQICNHPAQFLQDASGFSLERSHKLERLKGMLEEVVAAGDSVLIFSQFTESCEGLVKLLREQFSYPTHYLHGGTSRTRRERMIESFQDPDGAPSVFVLSLKAGGVGITLTKANHVFHFDRWWNPAVEDQASDRAYRIGQNKTVFVHKFVTIGTLEERINTMIEQKQAIADSVVGDGESWLAQLDDEHFRELIALNRDAVMT